MRFYPENTVVPKELKTSEFLVSPLLVSDAQADYEALMSSREMLRQWDQSGWPSDDFTLEENRADLEVHEAAHAARKAFTFTVMNPSGKNCLGCIYIYPLETTLQNLGAGSVDLTGIADFEAYMTFWVRESELAGKLEHRLLAQLLTWFDRSWSFRRITLGTNTEDTRQRALFREHGFVEKWCLPISGRESAYLICV